MEDISKEVKNKGDYKIPSIELLNKTKNDIEVTIRELIESDKFLNNNSKVTLALGKSVDGNYVIIDDEEIQSAFIIGSKKVECIDIIIASIIYKAKPDEVNLLVIDTKTIDLSIYNEIPHLLIPVVTEPKKAIGALAWVVQEVKNRFDLFIKSGVRNLNRYNVISKKEEKLPKIIVVINEITDLLYIDKKDVEEAIFRLIPKAKEAGVYIIIGTQYYSSKIISNNIKEIIPIKIICEDSNENMLFYQDKNQNALEINRAKISDEEIENIVQSIK